MINVVFSLGTIIALYN
ncbi:Protein of unknown function [Bacillus mycoides]|nr:Protein of unknown function [Bacillus mycoides]